MQISSKDRTVKIGVLSLWTLAIFIISFIFYIIGMNQKFFTQKYRLLMFVQNAQGLNPGAFITLSGLKVGVVGEMKFAKKDGQQGIVVELKINRKHAKMITTSSIATINTMGILGDKYVDISLGDFTESPLNEGIYIKTNPPLDVSAMAASAAGAIEEFKKTLNNVNKLTQQALNGSGVLGMLIADKAAQNNLSQLLSNLNRISDQISKGDGNLGKFVQDTSLYSSLKNTATNLDQISSKINRGQGSLGKMVVDTTLYTRLNSISILTDSLLNGLQRGKGATGKLLKEEALYNQLLLLTKSLNALTEDIKKNPKKYVTIKVF
jgi:phospholipid/cholesterol/gamma-HCH transport system substrate-binding protein